MAECCNEHGCTRKQPLLLLPSGFVPNLWHIVTRYSISTRDGRDVVESGQKHALAEETSTALTRWREAAGILAELVRLQALDPADRAAERAAWERARQVVGALEGGRG